MLRPDLKGQITQLRQLKGKTIATNGQGAVSTYEVGKMLETDGLTINDVDIKVIPFTQYALAFNNKAIDAAIAIPPFTAQLLDGGHAVQLREPRRARQAASADHRGEHDQHRFRQGQPGAHAQLLRRLSARHPRLLPGLSRRLDPRRPSSISRSAPAPRRGRELLHKYPWPARSPDGAINIASMLDMQAWYVKNKMSNMQFPAERIVDKSYVDYALRSSGRSCWRTRTASSPAAVDPMQSTRRLSATGLVMHRRGSRARRASRRRRRSSTPCGSRWCAP